MRFPQADISPQQILERFWPVGSIYASVSPANPADVLGFGAWVEFAQGRALVGVDPTDTDFDAAEKTSGSKTVALTESQLPAHTHPTVTDGGSVVNNGSGSAFATTNQTGATGSLSTGASGSGAAHPNVQPSIAVHLFKRIS